MRKLMGLGCMILLIGVMMGCRRVPPLAMPTETPKYGITNCPTATPVCYSPVIKDGVIAIWVSSFKEFGVFANEKISCIHNQKKIDLLVKKLRLASGMSCVLNVADAEYNIQLVYENEEENKVYHIWCDSDHGMLMDCADTQIGYVFDKQVIEDIKKIIE